MSKVPEQPPAYGVQELQPDMSQMPMTVARAQVTVGPESQNMTCPHCHSQVSTTLKSEATTRTHMIALLLFCCLCWPCAWVPYCMDSCMNVNHYCPACNNYIGTYTS